MEWKMLFSFGFLMIFILGVVIFLIKWQLFSSTESSVNRLREDIAKANAKQAELSQKIKEADEELEKRRREAKELADKMKTDAEEETKSEREKIISAARKEGEEIITKAQTATEKMREELEKEMDKKAITVSMDILTGVLSEKAKGAFNDVLINEYIESLKNTDMNQISPDVKSVEIVTLNPVDENVKSRISQIISEKLNRTLEVKSSQDNNLGGGVVLKFGSMALDGSMKNLIREKATKLAEDIEER